MNATNPFDATSQPMKDFVRGAAVPVICALCTLPTVLGAAIVTYHCTRRIGYVPESYRVATLPFNLTPPTNTLFQYVACSIAILLIGLLYGRIVLVRLGAATRGADFLVATASLPFLWGARSPRVALVAFGVRVALALFLAFAPWARRLETHRISRPMMWFTTMIASATFLSFSQKLLPSGFMKAIAQSPWWWGAICLVPFLLLLLERKLSDAGLRWERRVVTLVVLGVIPALTFHAGAADFDFSILVGPINDILLGKDILANVVSTYGFLSNYFIGAAFRIFRVQDPYIGLSVVDSVAYLVGYFSLFLFLASRIGSAAICLAFMITTIALHYFHSHIPIFWIPQAGFLRFGAFLPVFFLLYALECRPKSRALEWCFSGLLALSFFWTVEVGGYIAIAAIATVGRWLLSREPSGLRGGVIAGKVLLSVGGILALICTWVLARQGHWPTWTGLFHFQRAFSAGLAMHRLTSIERWPLPILVYLGTLYVAFRAPQRMRHVHAWVFLSTFGLALMAYPLGKAGIYDLARASLPAIILVASAVGSLFPRQGDYAKTTKPRYLGAELVVFSAIMAFTFASGCVVYADVAQPRREAQKHEKSGANPIAHRPPAWEAFCPKPDQRARFQSDLRAIEAFVPRGEALPILSKNDTLYYVYAQRKSLFENSFYPHFFLKSDIDEMVAALHHTTAPYLFVDNSGFRGYINIVDQAPMNQVWSQVRGEYVLLARAGFLDAYRRRDAPMQPR